MSIEISLDKQIDPFSKRFEDCSKPGCGGRLGLRIESKSDGGQETYQVCRKCGYKVLTAKVQVHRSK